MELGYIALIVLGVCVVILIMGGSHDGHGQGGGKRKKTMKYTTLAGILVGALLLEGLVKNNLM